MNLSKQSGYKELSSGEQSLKENTMNLSKDLSVDKELFSGERSSKENITKSKITKNTMNLSKQSGDKELFSGERSSKENIPSNYNSLYNKLKYSIQRYIPSNKNIKLKINNLEEDNNDTFFPYKCNIDLFDKNEKELFQNPLELQGIRIGETNNDVDSTFILKEIFGDFFDGFICPTIFSPFFDDNYIPNEILLFNPLETVINIDTLPSNSITININEILIKNNIMNLSKQSGDKELFSGERSSKENTNLFSVPFFMKNDEITYFQYGGKKNNIDYIFEKNKLINKKKKVNDLIKQGNEFKKNMINNKIKILNKEDYMFNKNNMINNL